MASMREMAEELPCDLMLLDVQMPKLSGFEVMELLVSAHRP